MGPQDTTERTSTIRWEQDADGVVVLTMDDPGASANTMNAAHLASFAATVQRLVEEKESITGVVLTSAKKTFFAGGNLTDLLRMPTGPEAAAASMERTAAIKRPMRDLETLGRPVVAAINGAALGGGLEIALACHHRVVADLRSTRIGFPEVTLGLLPGAGGVVRSVRLLGLLPALTGCLLQGQRLTPSAARELGLVDEVVPTVDDLLPAAKAWIAAHPDAAQPWDRPGYRLPGGAPGSPRVSGLISAAPATLRKQLGGAPYPAPRAILAAAVEGAGLDYATAHLVETRYFTSLLGSQIAKNMIRAMFFDLQTAAGRVKQYADPDAPPVRKVVVLGAGMMGAAIAYVAAKAGIEVVLKDVSQESAERGKGYSRRLVEKAVASGRSTEADGEALLARVTATADPQDAAGADLVIEAVFEDPSVKAAVYAEIEPVVAPDALLGSNTSTLPITGLAEHVTRPADFIGLHFFSPVDKMPLLEVIRGERTSDAALGRALAFAKQIGKTPIVVHDSRGFFTSRVIGTFTSEGLAMLGEGIAPASIEQASRQAGYPAPVLQLMDELTLTLPRKIRRETRAAVEAEGGTWTPHPADAVTDRMLDELDRPGRSSGRGFYEYDADGRRTGLWSGLEAFRPADGWRQIPFEDMQERMLFAEALETVKCLDEGVLESTTDANVGSILGIGFPGWTGGVARYLDQYPGGLAGFVARARELAERYGDRFTPPASLVERAESGGTYEEVA
ncbi:3-hydroxyacyl-CoA dehydrogenase NAD-binding domain-containing protein [Lapillicoccus jejuensis]|uniref:3-hydroxyacyl-CoA dehydrogenase/enoyl-CoA hydratase/3-hydroxybutyryl-CoA epimerase n=1 Tax=Lapillicoccus jejuensis TaxID=402171 RepID=A0A542E557_9MICO|nr:3-hydroxyacyl-CoA dehydrogenase NAD-binding domain-containing protein [Lapillicoccus jejuensis]TQJ10409.1 3-hydroxyacyl-CoA dehydrogenase/enoyl-CoA hydratase/3-hydroxybutyryl-CoA epimerase [Lapillicoccus jejuensis]